MFILSPKKVNAIYELDKNTKKNSPSFCPSRFYRIFPDCIVYYITFRQDM